MAADTTPVAAELFDSMVLDEDLGDPGLRLWYLRLWQALEDAKDHLNQRQLLNREDVIAGATSPRELKTYRNHIAHWHTGRIDRSKLNDLQKTVMELIRQKYG